MVSALQHRRSYARRNMDHARESLPCRSKMQRCKDAKMLRIDIARLDQHRFYKERDAVGNSSGEILEMLYHLALLGTPRTWRAAIPLAPRASRIDPRIEISLRCAGRIRGSPSLAAAHALRKSKKGGGLYVREVTGR